MNMTASKLAGLAGIGVESIRFYERKGVLPRPRRSASGYRLYTPDDARRVLFIKRAQDLGFTLREVKEFFALQVTSRNKCADVKNRTDRKILEIEAKIKDLRRMARTLAKLAAACACGEAETGDCAVLDCFGERMKGGPHGTKKKEK
jgi:DNA-binding transcriptional MerR regulator